jgi:chromosome condensin MukBEF complex kleisin-like MukF subunit
LAESTGEIPEAVEVEITDEIREQLPAEVEDPESVKLVDEELLEHVDGEEFDPVTRIRVELWQWHSLLS